METTADDSIVKIDRQALRLDPRNPRLVDLESEEELSQRDCAQMLLDRHDPVAIARSLAAFGFFPSDPLIGISENGAVIVVEGNRRLLAVQLLTDEALRDELAVDDEWDSLAETARENGHVLNEIPTQLVVDRVAAAPVIGFRHIVGIKRWDAWEKAAFVRDLVSQQSDPATAFDAVSALTGEKPARIRRYLRDYLVVRQAESSGVDAESAKKEFGVFTRALNSASINQYIDAKPSGDIRADDTRAYAGDDQKIKNVLGFLFGDNEENLAPVLSDARKIGDLGKVLAEQRATENLISTRNLEESLAMTGAIRDRALGQLGRAFAALSRAETDLQEIEIDDPIREVLAQIRDLTEALQFEDRSRAAELTASKPTEAVSDEYDLDLEDESADE